jgi:hypothetical protein
MHSIYQGKRGRSEGDAASPKRHKATGVLKESASISFFVSQKSTYLANSRGTVCSKSCAKSKRVHCNPASSLMRGITATGLQEYRGLPIHRSNNTFWATAFVVRGERDLENAVEVLEREKALETRRCSGNGMVLVTWAARYRNKSCVLA